MTDKDKNKSQTEREGAEYYTTIFQTIPSAARVIDTDFNVIVANPAMAALSRQSLETSVNRKCFDTFKGERCHTKDCPVDRIQETKAAMKDEVVKERQDGGKLNCICLAAPLFNNKGMLTGIVESFQDITELRRASEVIQRQAQEILEISTPVMQVWQGVLVAPLIGTLDSQRTQQFMERLLERIVETNSPAVLVDITGVPTIDTQTAQHLIDTISAVRLLGAQVILTGVRPPIAQTLVHLGVDLSSVTTRSSLAAGLLVAMDALGLQVVGGKRNTAKET